MVLIAHTAYGPEQKHTSADGTNLERITLDAMAEGVTRREVGVRRSNKLIIVHPAALHWRFVLHQQYHIIFYCFHSW